MARRKFSPKFERDYQFYFSQKDVLNFSGTDIKRDFGIQFPGESIPLDEEGKEIPFDIPYDASGKGAKFCFYKLDSEGKCGPCSEPQLLVELLNCKAAVNLQIKMWAQSRAEYTLPLVELQEYVEHFQAPEWVLKAVENQKAKILTEWSKDKNSYASRKETYYLHMSEALDILAGTKSKEET